MLVQIQTLLDNMTRSCQGVAAWPIRLAVAGIFLFHGLGKFMMPEMAGMMGLSQPVWLLVGAAEIAASLGFLAGGILSQGPGRLITRLSGLAIIPVMLGAIFMVHWGRWDFTASETHPMGGMEFQVLLLSVAIYALLTGFSPRSAERT